MIKSPTLLFAGNVKLCCPIVNHESAQQLQHVLLTLENGQENGF